MEVYTRKDEITGRIVSVTMETASHEEERFIALLIEAIRNRGLISLKTRESRIDMRFQNTKIKD